MTVFLLDTNVLSELRKAHCDAEVESWSDAQETENLFTSVIVFAEIRFGIGMVKDAAFKKELEDWLRKDLRRWYASRLLPVNEDVILRWREMLEKGRKAGYTFVHSPIFSSQRKLTYMA